MHRLSQASVRVSARRLMIAPATDGCKRWLPFGPTDDCGTVVAIVAPPLALLFEEAHRGTWIPGLWSFLRQAFIAATDVYCFTVITTVTLV